MEVLKFRRVLPNSETPRSESNIENLLLQPGVNEKRKVFMRVDERLFYIF